MSTLSRLPLTAFVAALAFGAGIASPTAQADDTEVFFTPVSSSDGSGSGAPNILFIVDSSSSMATSVSTGTEVEWSPTEDWIAKAQDLDPGFSCNPARLYWVSGSLSVSAGCAALPYVDVNLSAPDDASNKFVCKAGLDALSAAATQGLYSTQGIAQYNVTLALANRRWESMKGLSGDTVTLADTQPGWVTECSADDGVHGINATSTSRRPNNATTDGFGTNSSNNPNSVYRKAKAAFTGSFTFYTAQRMAFEYVRAQSAGGGGALNRLDAVKNALKTLINSLDGVNIGLMRWSNTAEAANGGMVVHEVAPISTSRQSVLDTLFTRSACDDKTPQYCEKIFEPQGNKSIGETMWEAYQYYKGGAVEFGLQSNIDPKIPFLSVPASRDGNEYISPITSGCSKNFIVLLSDGLTEQDRSKDQAIANLPDFDQDPDVLIQGGTAKCDPDDVVSGSRGSECVDDLAAYMFRNDMAPWIPGVQNVKTYTIGFDLDDTEPTGAAAKQVLVDAANRTDGQYFDVSDQASLEDAFTNIARQILLDNASFTAPSIAVNAFNRTQNLNDLFMSVFKPSLDYRWIGNVKKYRLTPQGNIVDSNTPPRPAVDPSTGYFAKNARSYWSTLTDGDDAALGGAAGLLDDPAGRTIYVNVAVEAGIPATVDSGALETELSALKDASADVVTYANQVLFGGTAPAAPSRVNLIDWTYGIDVQDKVGPAGDTTDPRLDMGDPLHSRPAVVVYGGSATSPDTTIYATTNDGLLHAIDAATGVETWAFLPVQMMPRLSSLYQDAGATSRVYGMDGAVRAYKVDQDQDGIVESADGDRVLLFFGMRRGGQHYFAMDVTNRAAPELLWRIGAEDDPALGLGTITADSDRLLPGIGQTWSNPAITRMNINRSWGSNTDKLVLVFGGGYDPEHDLKTSYADDAVGNRLYIVDAFTGDLIWRAGPTSDTTAQLRLASMKSAITADVRSFDITGDGFDDRMYTADLGGRIWRFDIVNGATPANLVKGGVFATLGVADTSGTPDTANRKFFFAADPSLIRYGGRAWINIAIGSGDRERPVSEQFVDNRFYSLRDYAIYNAIDSNRYVSTAPTGADALTPFHRIITASDARMTDVTSTLSPTLSADTVGWYMDLAETGEKALTESRTFQNAVYFTTYVPRERSGQIDCGRGLGVNKLFVVSAVNAAPVFNYDVSTPGATELEDRSKELAQGGLAPEVVFVFPTPTAANGLTPPAVPPVCLVGLETCGAGLSNPPVRTYWRQRGTN
jgi:type IV pilus assembly protein PilY1